MTVYATGRVPKDHAILRSISALIASLPASENKGFREEFDTVRSSSDMFQTGCSYATLTPFDGFLGI